MKPRTFSATAFNVADLCLARYKVEHIDRAKGPSGVAASLGTSVHGALELFVTKCIVASDFPATLDQLLEFFRMSYMTTFSTVELDTEEYADGVEMLKAW